jgi:hypothetical protein
MGSDGQPVNFGAPACLGEYSFTVDATGSDNTLSALLATATAPETGSGTTLSAAITAGLAFMLVTVETQNVRASFNSNDPSTTGMLYTKDNAQPYVWDPSDFTKVKIAGQGGSATLRVALFR